MKYRREVDGLRALAVIPVMFFHAGFASFAGGYVGVDVFFVISGYLITSIIVLEKEAGRFTLAGFYERRARRILPALFVVMAACVVPAWLTMLPGELKDFGQSLITVAVYTSNFLFWRESGYFAPAADEKPLLHTWSLAIEEQYYAVYPLLILVFWFLRRGGLTVFVSLGALLSIGFAEWAWRHQPSMAFYLIPTRAWELALGALIALRDGGEGRVSAAPRRANLLAGTGIVMILAAVFGFDERVPIPSLYTLIPTVGTALVLIYGRKGTPVARFLGVPALVGIGLMSYSLYLWHQPLFAFARIFSIFRPNAALYLVLMLVSAGLAYISYHYVERPFRNRAFLSRRTVFLLSAAASLFFVTVGTVIHFKDGFASRLGTRFAEESAWIRELRRERMRNSPIGTCDYFVDQMDVRDFVTQWDCAPGEGEPSVLVIGDSQAADKALALRLNEWNVGQLTGAGCSLALSRATPWCRTLFEAVPQNIDFTRIDAILLAQRWESTNVGNVDEIVRVWSRFGVPLILAGPMPEFRKFETRMPLWVSRWGSRIEAARRYPFDNEKYESMSAVREAAARAGVSYIDTGALFCSLTVSPSCSPVLGNDYLMSDVAHLSMLGARLFGERLAGRIREIAASGYAEAPTASQ